MDPTVEDPTLKKPPDIDGDRKSSQQMIRALNFAEAKKITRNAKLKSNVKKSKKKSKKETYRLKNVKGADYSISGADINGGKISDSDMEDDLSVEGRYDEPLDEYRGGARTLPQWVP